SCNETYVPMERVFNSEHFDKHLENKHLMVPELGLNGSNGYVINFLIKAKNLGTNISGTIRCLVTRRISKCSRLKTLSIGTGFVARFLWGHFIGSIPMGCWLFDLY